MRVTSSGANTVGKRGRFFGSGDLVVEPGRLEDPGVQELQCGAIERDRAPGAVPRFEQVQQVTSNVLRSQLFRRLPKVFREPLDGSQVNLLRALGQVA
jgi:hypothetical protein